MKPIIIVPPNVMSKEDLQALRDNDLCVVEAADPSAVKFLDPIPAAGERGKIEAAALELSRRVMSPDFAITSNNTANSFSVRRDIIQLFVEILRKGTPLDPEPSQQEKEQAFFNSAKREELQRLAREEAKAERAAAREAKKAAKEKK